MRLAVLSDVHANLPALEAVLRDLEGLQVDRVVCLGDLVGYNAQPNECLDRLRHRVDVCVAGNHDREALGLPVAGYTNRQAKLTLDWTARSLSAENASYLRSLPNIAVHESFVAVHGCFLNPDHYYGYVTSSMLPDNLEVIAQRDDLPKLAFCGHTHQPLLACLEGSQVREVPLGEARASWHASSRVVLVNPGSVGQPRDRDPRASYAVVDTTQREVLLRRVPYDIQATMAAIEAAGLPSALAERLPRGT
jgi:predicted phosphodiesterase